MLGNLNKVNESLLSESTQPKYNIYKYDVDSDRDYVVNELQIRSVPTIKVFNAGEVIETKVGVLTEGQIKELVNELTNG